MTGKDGHLCCVSLKVESGVIVSWEDGVCGGC